MTLSVTQAKPGLVTVAIFQFIGVWKEYFYAFMLTGGTRAAMRGRCRSDWPIFRSRPSTARITGCFLRGLVLVTLPIVIVYVRLQRHIVKGVAAGALKG